MKKISFVVFLVIFYSNMLSQSITYNQKFAIDPYNEFSKSYPEVAQLNGGGAVICWNRTSQTGTGGEIIAQIYDENLAEVGGNFIVSSDTTYGKFKPCVTGLENGGFVICWESHGQDGDHLGIFAQRFDQSGNRLGGELQVNAYTENWQMDPCIANLGGDRFVIAWEWVKPHYDSSYGIYAQIFDEDGECVGNEFKVNTDTTNWQLNPSVAGLSNGGFIVCWNNGDYLEISEGDVLAQIFDENGVKAGNEFLVNNEAEWRWQGNPDICTLAGGEFIICWESIEFSNRGIFAQIFDENGIKIGEKFKISGDYPHPLSHPQLCRLSNGGFAVCWVVTNDGRVHEITIQLYNDDGTKKGNKFQVNDYSDNSEFFQSIASLENGKIITCWASIKKWEIKYAIMGNYYLGEPINHNLIDYDLAEPVNDSTITDEEVDFSWDHASNVHINFPWELTYDFYIDADISFSNPIIQPGIQDSTFQIDSLANGQTYYWKVLARNISGDSLWSSTINSFTIDTTAVVGINIINPEIPKSFNLYQNYPNPFNPTTKIKFTIPTSPLNPSPYQGEGNRERFITLRVYDILGNEIATLVNEQKSPGTYEVEFSTSGGQGLSSGIYFYKLNAGSFSQTKKMLLMK